MRMKTLTLKTFGRSRGGFFCLVLLLTTACTKTHFDVTPAVNAEAARLPGVVTPQFYLPATPQLVVWIKPGRTNADFTKWVDSVRGANGTVTVSRTCESCDNSLNLLTGAGIANFIQGNTVSGGKGSTTKTPSTGENGPVYFCLNFAVAIEKPAKTFAVKLKNFQAGISNSAKVKVGILDTGIDTALTKKYPFRSTFSSCIPGADYGWNFIARSNSTQDDHAIRHGSIVAKFAAEQVDKYALNNIELLPVKTHSSTGGSDLFTVLCALAYAKQRGVNIINASFGFYLPRLELLEPYKKQDPNALLLKEYIRYYLTRNNILLVASAGNSDDVNERAAFDAHGLPYPVDPRNLDQVSFYPASLARSGGLTNVITVTTVNTLNGTVSPSQNYSNNVVDVGVSAERIISDSEGLHYIFLNSFSVDPQTVEGSSFAAPIVTGILASNYTQIKPVINRTGYTKADIWNVVLQDNVSAGLISKIKNGRYVKR